MNEGIGSWFFGVRFFFTSSSYFLFPLLSSSTLYNRFHDYFSKNVNFQNLIRSRKNISISLRSSKICLSKRHFLKTLCSCPDRFLTIGSLDTTGGGEDVARNDNFSKNVNFQNLIRWRKNISISLRSTKSRLSKRHFLKTLRSRPDRFLTIGSLDTTGGGRRRAQ